ncbi:MAG TPA: hypothetical protein VJL36_02835 [Candidatus Paceibacterota bacterium]
MTILSFFFLTVALLSFGLMALILFWPDRRAAPAGPSWAEILAPIILATAAGLILTAKHLTKTVYLFLLLIVHRLALAVKNICHRIENRFSKLIRAVHGRGERSLMEKPRGAVSFFLEQIKIDKPR